MQTNVTIFQKLKKTFLIATVVLLSLSALLSIIMILFGASATQFRVVGTTAVLGAFSSLIVSNILRIDGKNRSLQVLAWIALITSLVATIIIVLMIWGAFERHCADYYYSSGNYDSCYTSWQSMIITVSKTLWICITVAINASIVGRFLEYDASNTLINIFRSGTIACALFLCVFFVCCTLVGDFPTGLWQFIVILIILLVLGLIVTPILVMVNKHRDQQIVGTSIQANEQALRAQIEQEVRAKIAAEEQAKAALAFKPSEPTAAQPDTAVPPAEQSAQDSSVSNPPKSE